MILCDRTIRRMAKDGMIEPFAEKDTFHGVSYGLSPASYDFRLDQDLILWPGRFVLASTLEKVAMPNDVCAIVHDKSTWARRGVAVQNTLIDPGFRGHVTLEITLHSWRLLRIPRGTAICQFTFHVLDLLPEKPYRGKYQDQQRGPVEAR
jgi:dCTP deaminase